MDVITEILKIWGPSAASVALIVYIVSDFLNKRRYDAGGRGRSRSPAITRAQAKTAIRAFECMQSKLDRVASMLGNLATVNTTMCERLKAVAISQRDQTAILNDLRLKLVEANNGPTGDDVRALTDAIQSLRADMRRARGEL